MLMLTKHQVEAVLYFVLFMADLNEPLGHSRVRMNNEPCKIQQKLLKSDAITNP